MIPRGRRAATLRHVRFDIACYVFSWLAPAPSASSSHPKPTKHRFGAFEFFYFSCSLPRFSLFLLSSRLEPILSCATWTQTEFISVRVCAPLAARYKATKQIKIHKIISSHQSSSSASLSSSLQSSSPSSSLPPKPKNRVEANAKEKKKK